MSHSFTKVMIHAIWSTKNREPLIKENFEIKLHNHISQIVKEQDCFPKIVNGMSDHIHVLFDLHPAKALQDVLKNIKGNSSHWVNTQNFMQEKFAWQTGYGAYAVSESQVQKVYDYIANQKEHHRTKTFQEEYEGFLRVNGFSVV